MASQTDNELKQQVLDDFPDNITGEIDALDSRNMFDNMVDSKLNINVVSTAVALGSSDVLLPTQNAVKEYVDSIGALPSGAEGDMLYYDGTGWVALNPGTSGYILQTNGASIPTWVPAPTSTTNAQGLDNTVQFNDSSTFNGITDATSDGTNLKLGGYKITISATEPSGFSTGDIWIDNS